MAQRLAYAQHSLRSRLKKVLTPMLPLAHMGIGEGTHSLLQSLWILHAAAMQTLCSRLLGSLSTKRYGRAACNQWQHSAEPIRKLINTRL